jgi:murein DD-endopeptidase MepM/ murein hydrolase activator NlpD
MAKSNGRGGRIRGALVGAGILVWTSTVAGFAACTAVSEPPAPAKVPVRGIDVNLRAETRALAARVGVGMTLGSLLQGTPLSAAEAAAVLAAAETVFDPRKLRVDQPYRLVHTLTGVLRRFEYEIDGDRFLRVTRGPGERLMVADVLPIPKTRTTAVVAGMIDRAAPSLFAAVAAAGGTVELALALADVFSGDIDFNTELQPGDTFTLAAEKQLRETGAFAGYGPIAAAEFENEGRRLRAIRFERADGAAAYFDEQGVSVRRFMLRSPLKFDPVVTSGFSRRRLHPIFGERRAHLGVDYRAPAGAPVVAVAHGVVLRAEANGGAGRMVHLRHANGFETEYLHLSSIAVRAGERVQQGAIIGRVGATGVATGPHLDYRVRKSGVFIDPLTATRDMPPADPVPPDEMAAFTAVRDRALEALRRSPSPAEASSP